ncbi:MAG: glycosyltransferase [Bryobacteraceae bacterium]
MLDAALTRAGDHSVVLAAEGSAVTGTLLASPRASGHLDDSVREWGRRVHHQLLHEAIATYAPDLVHMHSLDFHSYMLSGNVPVLATLHLPPDWYPPQVFQAKRDSFYMNCVSQSQHRNCPASSCLLDPIPNGVDVSRLAGKLPKQDFALALGRICPEKGFHLALQAAKVAGTPLRLAGEIFPYPSHLEYFRTEIEPLLSEDRSFIGPQRFDQKKSLLAEARCLLISSTVAETSSLVAMEALACGTPVIAFPAGALPEIIEHGRTGFLVSTVEEMSRALLQVNELDPEVCRATALERFGSASMCARYLDLYDTLIPVNPVERVAFEDGGLTQRATRETPQWVVTS